MLRTLRKIFSILFVVTPLFMLSACCSPGVKPGEANLFQAGCGVASGQYEKDLADKNKQVEQSKKEKKSERGRSLQLEGMLVTRQGELKNAQQELNALEQENNDLAKHVESMQVKTQKDRALNEKYLVQLKGLNAEISALKARAQEAPDEDYLVKFEELKSEVETLRIIVLGQ